VALDDGPRAWGLPSLRRSLHCRNMPAV
jgi:hypothetical protein